MSVSIATMGMFNPCCGGGPSIGGGAPPYRQNDQRVTPTILIRHVELVSVKNMEDIVKNISVKLKDS